MCMREQLPRTIEWMDGRVRFINQLKLPDKLEYVETSSPERVAEAISRMEIRGAPAIGVAAAMTLALAAVNSQGENILDAVKKTAETLLSTRPTAYNLYGAVSRVLRRAEEACNAGEDATRAIVEEALKIAHEDEEANRRIGKAGEQLIEEGARVLTICNAGSLATSYYGTATAPMYAAHERGKSFEVIVLETRPYLQGARLTAWELSRCGIKVTIAPDNHMGILMQRGLVDIVLTGADRVAISGHVANKVGTYPLAVMAHRHSVPLYVCSPMSTVDPKVSGENMPIETRSADEVLYFAGKRIAPEGVNAVYYAFDVTPPELITGIVTELGIAEPPYQRSLKMLVEQYYALHGSNLNRGLGW